MYRITNIVVIISLQAKTSIDIEMVETKTNESPITETSAKIIT